MTKHRCYIVVMLLGNDSTRCFPTWWSGLMCNTGSYFMASSCQSNKSSQSHKNQTARQYPSLLEEKAVCDGWIDRRGTLWGKEEAHTFAKKAWHISVDKTSHVTTMKMAQLMVFFFFFLLFSQWFPAAAFRHIQHITITERSGDFSLCGSPTEYHPKRKFKEAKWRSFEELKPLKQGLQ